jgi:two-component system chemotaxis response regulator CheY
VVTGEPIIDTDKTASLSGEGETSSATLDQQAEEAPPNRTPSPRSIPEDFLAEVEELFDSITSIIDDLRKDHNAEKLVNKLYRTIHTIYGSASMYDYDQLSEFCYQVESAVNSVKQGFAVINDHALDLIVEAKDLMRITLELNDPSNASHKNTLADIVGQLEEWAVSAGDVSHKKSDQEEEPSSAKELALQKILIVEDEFVSRYLLEEFLSPYGTSHSAVDGYEAVLAFKTALIEKRPYNLVCLDIMMPGLDGREVAKEIRRLEKEINVESACKVVMTTAVTDEKVKEDMLASGLCDAYMNKPLQLDKLTELIDTFFGN